MSRRSRHLLESIRDRFQAMMGTSSSRSKATELGWISSDGKLVHGLKWDPQQMRHTRDETVESLDPRTEAAQKTWHHLNLLARSAVWAAGSCFLRHDRLQMSPLAKRLASLTQ